MKAIQSFIILNCKVIEFLIQSNVHDNANCKSELLLETKISAKLC